jgi:CRISPR system Cascade subunit CasA
MPDPAEPGFNLWTEGWIALEKPDGSIEKTGIKNTLLHAEGYRSIYDPSPLTMVGIHRLLVAILQFIIRPEKGAELKKLWKQGIFPADAIDSFGMQYARRFDLFSSKEPFLQSGDIPLAIHKRDAKSVTYLAPEIPGGTGVTHFRHGGEDVQVFCPACAARGLVTIPAFATSGGSGIKPSINGVPPIYILPGGMNLFESLAASLTLPEYQPEIASRTIDEAWWVREALVGKSAVVGEVGYLHSLTFPARRVRLFPENLQTNCSQCNAECVWGVRQMVFEMGESRPKDSAFWFDPFAAYKIDKERPIPFRPVEGKATWREFASLFLLTKGDERSRTRRPSILEQIADLDLVSNLSVYPFRCTGMRTDMKAKVFEWMDAGFEVPPSMLKDASAGFEVRQATEYAAECASIIGRTFRQYFGGRSKKSERNKGLRLRMVNGFWSDLAESFRHYILKTAIPQDRHQAHQDWAVQVQKQAALSFRMTVESLGDDAETLCQGAIAEKWCNIHLAKKRKEYLDE